MSSERPTIRSEFDVSSDVGSFDDVNRFAPEDKDTDPICALMEIQCSLEGGDYFFDEATLDNILKNPLWREFDKMLYQPIPEQLDEQEARFAKYHELHQQVLELLHTETREQIMNLSLNVISPQQLEQYVRHGKASSSCAELCPICIDEYDTEDIVGVITCRHAFHPSCLNKWLETGQINCSLCRTALISTRIDSDGYRYY